MEFGGVFVAHGGARRTAVLCLFQPAIVRGVRYRRERERKSVGLQKEIKPERGSENRDVQKEEGKLAPSAIQRGQLSWGVRLLFGCAGSSDNVAAVEKVTFYSVPNSFHSLSHR